MSEEHLTPFEQLLLLEETPNSAQSMDITELKALYYGRLDMFGSFSNDEKLEKSGIDNDGELKRPYAISGYDVRDIVGRTVNSPKFYAHVFRIKPSGGKLLKTESYDTVKFTKDSNKLKAFFGDEYISDLVNIVNRDPRIRYEAERLWKLTKLIALPYDRHGDKVWADIFKKLEYYAIEDNKGIVSKDRKAVTYIFDEQDLEIYDIVPIQKYKVDKRGRVIERIKEKTKRMYIDRSRVAQKQTDYGRDVRKKHDFLSGE